MNLIDLDNDRHCFVHDDAEYETWNIDPDAPPIDAIPIEFIKQQIQGWGKDEIHCDKKTMAYWIFSSKRIALQQLIDAWKKEQGETE